VAEQEELLFIMRMRDEATRVLNRQGRGFRQAGSAAKSATRDFEGAGRAIRDAAAAMAGIVASTRLLRGTVGAFGDFEAGVLGVAKTTGLAGRELELFSREFAELSLTLPVATADMQAIAQVAGQLGIQGRENILEFTDVIARLGTASNLAGEEGATSIARMLNVMGEGTEEARRLASVLVRLGNNSAASEQEIARMATEISLATAAFETGTTAAAGIAAAMASLGLRAEIAGTSVGRTFRAINEAAREGGEAVEEIARVTGVTQDALQDLVRESPERAFLALLQTLNELGPTSTRGARLLESLNLQQEEINKTIVPLAQNFDKLTRSMDLAFDEASNVSALDEEFEIFASGVNSRLIVLQDNMNQFATALGKALDVKDTIDAASEAIGGLTASFRDLPEETQRLLALMVTLGPALLAAAAAVRTLALAFRFLNLTALLVNPVTAAIAVIGTLAVTLTTVIGRHREAAEAARAQGEALARLQGQAGEALDGLDELNREQLRTIEIDLVLARERLNQDAAESAEELREFFRDQTAIIAPADDPRVPFLRRVREIQAEFVSGAIGQAEAFERLREAARETGREAEVINLLPETREFVDAEERLDNVQQALARLRSGASTTREFFDDLVSSVSDVDVRGGRQQEETDEAADLRASTRERIELIFAETQARREGAAALRQFEERQSRLGEVDAFRKLAEEAGFTADETERMAQMLQLALRVRDEDAARLERQDFLEQTRLETEQLMERARAAAQGEDALRRVEENQAIEETRRKLIEEAKARGVAADAARELVDARLAATQSLNENQEALRQAAEQQRRAEEAARDIAREFTRSASEIVFQSDSIGDAFGNLARRLSELILQITLFQPFEQFIGNALGGSSLFAGLFHGGGRAESPDQRRMVPAALFAGAPRFQSGTGLVGKDEFPAILHRGERVLSRDETQALQSGGGGGIAVSVTAPVVVNGERQGGNVQVGTRITDRQARQLSRLLEDEIGVKVKKVLVDEARPGGILDPQQARAGRRF